MAAGRDDRSLGELFAELASETSTLVRQELRQAGKSTPAAERVTGVGKDIGVLVAGAVVIHAGFLALVAAIIFGLDDLGLPSMAGGAHRRARPWWRRVCPCGARPGCDQAS